MTYDHEEDPPDSRRSARGLPGREIVGRGRRTRPLTALRDVPILRVSSAKTREISSRGQPADKNFGNTGSSMRDVEATPGRASTRVERRHQGSNSHEYAVGASGSVAQPGLRRQRPGRRRRGRDRDPWRQLFRRVPVLCPSSQRGEELGRDPGDGSRAGFRRASRRASRRAEESGLRVQLGEERRDHRRHDRLGPAYGAGGAGRERARSGLP